MSIVAIRRRVVSFRVDRMNRTKRRAVNTGARPVRASPAVSMHAKPGGSPLITFSEDALALVGEKQSPVFIDVPYTLRGCCFDMTECPAVRFGEPTNSSGYVRQDAQGVTLYVPSCLSGNDSLTIRMRSLLGFRSLVIDGWKLT